MQKRQKRAKSATIAGKEADAEIKGDPFHPAALPLCSSLLMTSAAIQRAFAGSAAATGGGTNARKDAAAGKTVEKWTAGRAEGETLDRSHADQIALIATGFRDAALIPGDAMPLASHLRLPAAT